MFYSTIYLVDREASRMLRERVDDLCGRSMIFKILSEAAVLPLRTPTRMTYMQKAIRSQGLLLYTLLN